jgi:hypothetical protein
MQPMTDTQPPTQPANTSQSEDPSTRELLGRIIRLEAQNANLTARCDDLLTAFKSNVDGNLDTFARLYDLIFALVDKVFPNYLPTMKKINAIAPEGYADPVLDTRPHEYKRD